MEEKESEKIKSEELITKIEGHGALHLNWGKKEVRLEVLEGERLFEGILTGRKCEEAPWITSRICGVCPIAHNLAAIKAVEMALGIEPNETTKQLRRLMIAAQMIQSHTLHLFFLSLPDYLGIDRGTELAKRNPKLFQAALALKETSDVSAAVVAGRNVHPTTTTPGGFHKLPTKKELEKLLELFQKTKNSALLAAKTAAGIKYPNLQIDFELVSQINPQQNEYPVYDGHFTQSDKDRNYIPIKRYKETITEEIKSYSTAKFGKYKNKQMFVGALARICLNASRLKPKAGKILRNSKIDFKNPFHNNLAQAIEILHFYEEAIEILQNLLTSGMNPEISQPASNPPLNGIGAVEAPRGGLYHEFKLNENKEIEYANIITPTVQNLTSIELSGKELLKQYPNLTKEKTHQLVEMLVRAYDPCITCAVH